MQLNFIIENNWIISLIFLLIIGFFIVKSDFKNRKVSNKLNLTLFIYSLILFFISFYINKYSIIQIIFIGFFILIPILFYKYTFWGAADGKIFISLILIIFSIQQINGILNFIINTMIYYLITIFFLILIKTSKKDKIISLKKIKYFEKIFILENVFLIILIFLKLKSKLNLNNFIKNSIYLLILIILIYLVYWVGKKYINKFNKDCAWFQIIIIFLLLFAYFQIYFLNYILILLPIRIIFELITELSGKIRNNGIKYESPFTIYLFAGIILTLISNSNIIIITIKFLKNILF